MVIYVHGKGGTVEEAKHYKPLFPESDVIGFDYRSQNPWEAKIEFSDFYEKKYLQILEKHYLGNICAMYGSTRLSGTLQLAFYMVQRII